MNTFIIGDTVTHSHDGIDTDIVRGVVTGIRGEEVEIKWADGSGPTWQLAHYTRLLERRPADGLLAAYQNYHAGQNRIQQLLAELDAATGYLAELAAKVIQEGGEI